ncbi:MAG TPA: hypothetical protein VHZ95_13180, partial [Polyangiales bacterium]|nr:hypothetical protein [Polyangiales bacterium]
PALRSQLLAANLVWIWGVKRLAVYIDKKMPSSHPVLSQLMPFLAHALRCAELRIERMGLCEGPISELPRSRKLALLATMSASKVAHSAWRVARAPLSILPFVHGQTRLTDTYLNDPAIRSVVRESRVQPRLSN